jgi:hypothetical protein
MPDSHSLAAYGGLLLGCVAGAGFAVAFLMQFAPDLFGGGVCELTRLDSEGVRALILKDDAERGART